MRLSAPVLIVCAALAAVWARAALPPAPKSDLAPHPAAAAARAGLSSLLSQRGFPPLGAAMAEAGPHGLWRLRARAARPDGPAQGWPAPLYAEAEALCDAGLERPACWRLRRLELDGEARRLREEADR